MKKYRTTIIALIIIAVAVAGYLAVDRFWTSDKPEDEKGSQTDPDSLYDTVMFPGIDTKNIETIESHAADVIVLRKAYDEWTCVSYPDLPFFEASVSTVLNRISGMKGKVVYTGEITESILADYGLDGKSYLLLTMADGSTVKLIFGANDLTGGEVYTLFEGDNRVFRTDNAHKTTLLLTKKHLISSMIFDFDDEGKTQKVLVSKTGEKEFELTADFSGETRKWNMIYPISIEGNQSNINDLLKIVCDLSITDITEANCADLSQYGLEKPLYAIRLKDHRKTESLEIGNRTQDGNYFYCTLNGGSDVYTISAASVTFTDETAIRYLSGYAFLENYTVLSKVIVTVAGETYTLEYDTEGKAKDEEILTINGISANQPDHDCRDMFREITNALYRIELENIELTPPPTDNVVCSIVYERKDGSRSTVTCFYRDDITVSIFRDGKYLGGYCSLRRIMGPASSEGILGTITALLEALNHS